MNIDIKRHIDSARQVLVGVVPNPTSQIDQITNALIYKFMDDMDQLSIKNGGEPSFFVGDLEKYSWTRIMDSRIGNQERMNLFIEGFIKISESENIPQLFRNILKSAYLPYRSPEVLGLFLKEINYFDYSHPEDLGDAYEYLLSIMSSQGDAGQFRTPRHIIDFIVDAVNPTVDDKVLDPACGTAGFLISAYKHILEQHDGANDPENKEKSLTPDQRKKLFNNFEGYDIDPGMVRIAQVNMYLHQFKNPKIFQYDSLSMEERWNDKFDVILANPPFMSPKGGIKPHTKFSIQSSRSEVLFVDYIINHLRPKGRAGVIVPEGIVFQSGIAYKQLRKNLIEDGLYAVVSLPSGVFNPYAGVKTSILLFDNELAKQKSEILFIKVENDGFDLGAQRRVCNKNDLPEGVEVISRWKKGEKVDTELVSYVEKSKIAESGDYNLSSDRYRIATDYADAKWPMVSLKKVIKINFGERITKEKQGGAKYPVYGGGGESFRTDNFNREDEFVISRFAMSENCVRFVKGQFWMMDSGGTFSINEEYKGKLDKDFVGKILLNKQKEIFMCARGGAQKNLSNDHFYEIEIPLPPLEIQKQVVNELDGYQKIIDGAKQIVANWKPKIDINPMWDKVKLGDVCDFLNGKAHEEFINENGKYVVVNSKFIASDSKIRKYSDKFLSPLSINDVVMVMSDVPNGRALAKCFLVDKNETYTLNQRIGLFRPKNLERLDTSFLYLQLNRNRNLLEYDNHQSQSNLRRDEILNCPLFLPKIEEQKQIVEKVEEERKLVECNKKLMEIFQNKIKDLVSDIYKS